MLAGKIGYFRASFTPRAIANLAAWWDCSDSTRYQLVSNLVSSFTDSTGTYTITQGTAGNRPSISSIGSRSAFAFNGSSTSLFNNTAVASPWGTYFAVAVSGVADRNNRNIYGSGTNSPSVGTVVLHTPANLSALSVSSRIGSAISGLIAQTDISANTAYVMSATAANPQAFTIRVNGAAGSRTGFSSSSNSSGISLGAQLVNGNPGGFWNGRIGEVIWYSRVLTSTEISQVELYLSSRWGIAF